MRHPLFSLILALLLAAPALAATDYFVVNSGGGDDTSYVFSYDTAAKSVSLVDTAPWAVISGNGNPSDRVSAGADYSFWTAGSGQPTGEGAERFVTGDLTTWSSALQVNLRGENGANEFYDSSVRGAVNTDTVSPGAAELADGTVFAADRRIDGYGVGTRIGHAGNDPAIFTADAQHLGSLNSGLGTFGSNGENAADVASTVAGSADRFAVTGVEGDHLGGTEVQVYNADGTFRGNLTDLSDRVVSALGSMKTPGNGDVILQLSSDHGTSPTIEVNGVSAAEADFDTVIISTFNISKPGSGDFFFRATDVDGTESGLIVVVGHLLSPDRVGVQFFDTAGNPTTTNAFDLSTFNANLVGRNNASVAGLFQAVPEPATMGLLALGGIAMAGATPRKRKRH